MIINVYTQILGCFGVIGQKYLYSPNQSTDAIYAGAFIAYISVNTNVGCNDW